MVITPKATLKIVIKKEFFDMIVAKVKTEEFREDVPHWRSRLYDSNNKKKHFDLIEFINGYQTNARRVITEFKGVTKKGDKFIIGIGKIIKKNF